MTRKTDEPVPGPDYIEIDGELAHFMDIIHAGPKASAAQRVADLIRAEARQGWQTSPDGLAVMEYCALVAEAEARRYVRLANCDCDKVQ